MKKTPIFLGIVAIAVIFLGLAGTGNVKASQSATQVNTNGTSNSTATSTATYLTTSIATSTTAFDPEGSDVIHVYIASYSTSTPPVINVGLEVSNNNSDWYPYQKPSVSSSVALTAGTRGDLYSWSAATTTANETVTTSFPIAVDTAAKYARLTYKVGSGGASNVHIEVAQKKQF